MADIIHTTEDFCNYPGSPITVGGAGVDTVFLLMNRRGIYTALIKDCFYLIWPQSFHTQLINFTNYLGGFFIYNPV